MKLVIDTESVLTKTSATLKILDKQKKIYESRSDLIHDLGDLKFMKIFGYTTLYVH